MVEQVGSYNFGHRSAMTSRMASALADKMITDPQAIVSFHLSLNGPHVSTESLHDTLAPISGVEIGTEIEISVDYGPINDWRSLGPTLLRVLRSLEEKRELIRHENIEASVLIASKDMDTWIFEPEVISTLSESKASLSIRIIETSD